MRQLKNIIVEKLKINKDTKSYLSDFIFKPTENNEYARAINNLKVMLPFDIIVNDHSVTSITKINLLTCENDDYWQFFDNDDQIVLELTDKGVMKLLVTFIELNVTYYGKGREHIVVDKNTLNVIKESLIDEKLKINSNTGTYDFTDEEMVNDYNEVHFAYTKAEKKAIADKYGITDLRIRPIEIAILDLLRENRKKKKEFTKEDITNFFRYDIPDTYNKFAKYLDEEPIEFVEFMKQTQENIIDKNPRIKKYRYYPQALSYADRHQLKMYDNFVKYLQEH